MVNIRAQSLLGLLSLNLAVLSRAEDAAISLPHSDEIICSPENPEDCYPKLFRPTSEFQIIRDGQDIPPGLHVRMDIYSGKKEARLNMPEEGEAQVPEVLELSKEQAIVVVPQPEESEADTELPQSASDVQNLMKAPVYDTIGKIPPPPPSSGDEISAFHKALLGLKMEARSFDSSLDVLLELAHDIYYGLEITKDGPVLEKLICLTLGSGTEKYAARDKSRDKKAANILAASIQNNPAALVEISSAWGMVMHPTCGPDLQDAKAQGKGDFVAFLRNSLGKEKDPSTLKAKVGAISGLLREERFRTGFLDKKGMELLLAIFLKQGSDFDGVKAKVAQCVMDNFLDEELGAVTGWWPKAKKADQSVCKVKKQMLTDGCWEHHVEAHSIREPGQAWAKMFLKQLGDGRNRIKDEL